MYDKYAMFLHGNNGLSRVQGDGTGKILVIKDSYANCFVPYLTANYADIDVVDFRNYNFGLDQLIATTIMTRSWCCTALTASRATPTSTAPEYRLNSQKPKLLQSIFTIYSRNFMRPASFCTECAKTP